jgi:threonine aldolase
VFGGALRQAGIVAAGCLYALDHHVERLADDHENARQLAAGLNDIEGVLVHNPVPESNMVFFSTSSRMDHDAVIEGLAARGVLMGPVGDRIRAVTHLDVDARGISRAVAAVAEVLAGPPGAESVAHQDTLTTY